MLTRQQRECLVYLRISYKSKHITEREFFEGVSEVMAAPGRSFRTYPNPMRDDGVFVAEDIPLHPEEGVSFFGGVPFFPAVPRRAISFPSQLPIPDAERLVWYLNHKGETTAQEGDRNGK